MSENDWKWRAFGASTATRGVRLALKMADPDGHISYAFGIADNNTGELTFLAQENPNAQRAVFWLVVPD